ncbi:PQ loop repeat-domain-containing protein [Neurospora hispaniola]|uniref:PQ loop repeat-domain-containing protein n=1 Tax=Neurospora hispaniola TaxID=588809 RepID=A0AAJ0MT10_9PEZI|nr:PQ loop repeat-domain-containing protein [Neurospora hispaniola]
MAPPTELLNLDVEAISGILGSVSIACWVVVFSPQIIENFRRSSADGLSIQFIIIWLTGDVFNILGAVLQGVLPTMLILAIYYTIADVVLLAQCFYYRGFTWRDEVVPTIAIDSDDSEATSERDMGSRRGKNKGKGRADGSRGTSSDEGRRVGEDLESGPDERTALLGGARERGNAGVSSSSASTITSTTLTPHHHNNGHTGHGHHLRVCGGGGGDLYPYDGTGEGRGSSWSHLSPAVPLVDDADLEAEILQQPRGRNGNNRARPAAAGPTKLQSFLFNLMAILMVCAAGVMGWFLSREYYPQQPSYEPPPSSDPQDGGLPKTGVEFSFWGQIYGYLSAILYLGSRLPQLLLNFRRKSTEGVSMLFFLFACLGNLTYVLSILAYDGSSECAAGPGDCEDGEPGQIYWRYVLINMSWLAGSAGTLLLDAAIFIQFFLYSNEEVWSDDEDDSEWDSESGSGSGSDGCSVISERSGTVSEDGQAGVEQGQESDGRGWDSDDERSKLDEAEVRGRRRRAERDVGVRGGASVGAGGSESGRL